MDRKISIFVCGVQKGGTTSLYAYFKKHSELSAPRHKELHIFDNEKLNWNAPDFSMFYKLFSANDEGCHRFDITPIYGFWPRALKRMQRYNPAAKLIFLFRDPFDRAWSQWCMEYARGVEPLTFAQAIREGRSRVDLTKRDRPLRIFSYVERGLYADQVQRALELFPRENILFLQSKDLLTDHMTTLNRITEFLGIRSFSQMAAIRDHKRPKIEFPALPTELDRAWVAKIVRDDVEAFAALTGLDVSGWSVMREPAAA